MYRYSVLMWKRYIRHRIRQIVYFWIQSLFCFPLKCFSLTQKKVLFEYFEWNALRTDHSHRSYIWMNDSLFSIDWMPFFFSDRFLWCCTTVDLIDQRTEYLFIDMFWKWNSFQIFLSLGSYTLLNRFFFMTNDVIFEDF